MTTESDEARRAYAVLGLAPGAAVGQIRRRYRALIKQWHPDRHPGDPRNQAEATARMREINAAYRRIAAGAGRQGPTPVAVPTSARAPQRGRLSREEVEGFVEAIGSEGPVDWLLGGIGWVGSTLEGVLFAAFLIISATRIVWLVWRGNFAALFRDPELLLVLALVGLLVVREVTERRKLRE